MKTAPHKCPVCNATGRVANGFYPDAPGRTECRACDGKGVLWGWEEDGVRYVPVPQPYPVYPTYPAPYVSPPPVRPYQTWWWTTTGKTSDVSGGMDISVSSAAVPVSATNTATWTALPSHAAAGGYS